MRPLRQIIEATRFPTAIATPIVAAPATDEKLQGLWRQRVEIVAELDRNDNEDEREELFERLHAIEREMDHTKPQSVTGLVMKLRVMEEYARDGMIGGDWLATALTDAERLAAGVVSPADNTDRDPAVAAVQEFFAAEQLFNSLPGGESGSAAARDEEQAGGRLTEARASFLEIEATTLRGAFLKFCCAASRYEPSLGSDGGDEALEMALSALRVRIPTKSPGCSELMPPTVPTRCRPGAEAVLAGYFLLGSVPQVKVRRIGRAACAATRR
jgi:hypothetical protein